MLTGIAKTVILKVFGIKMLTSIVKNYNFKGIVPKMLTSIVKIVILLFFWIWVRTPDDQQTKETKIVKSRTKGNQTREIDLPNS